MSVSTPPTPATLECPPVPVRKFTVDEYHRMIDAGFFVDDDRFELLEGWIVPKMTRGPNHDVVTLLLQESINKLLPPGWKVWNQAAATTDDSEPEPDLMVVRGDPRDYRKRHPGPADIALVVEVADSSLSQDRGIKQRLYARAGIRCYWVVSLRELRFEVYEGTAESGTLTGYPTRHEFGMDQQVPLVIDGQTVGQISVREILA